MLVGVEKGEGVCWRCVHGEERERLGVGPTVSTKRESKWQRVASKSPNAPSPNTPLLQHVSRSSVISEAVRLSLY